MTPTINRRDGVARGFYPFLHGIRGLAAIFVLARHTSLFWNFFPARSYLGVDVFFVLSGLVIAFSYEAQLHSGALSGRRFALIRLIRLYPVYALSVIVCFAISLIQLLLRGELHGPGVLQAATIDGLALFFLPSHIPGHPGLFPSNWPYWSLFFELIVNFIYGALGPMLTTARLKILLTLLAIALASGAILHGTIDFGSTWGVFSIAGGLARASFGIFAGVIIARKREKILRFVRRTLGFSISPWFPFLAIALILASPSVGRFDCFVDLTLVFIVFPTLVVLSTLGDAGRYQSMLLILGAASYPMYVLHAPLGSFIASVAGPTVSTFAPLSGLIFTAAIIGLALFTERVYDLPARRWLSGRLLATSSAGQKVRATTVH